MQSNRCGHYSPEAELIVVSGAPLVIRIPVRRCLLAEQMLAQIAQTDAGLAVARKLSIASAAPSPAQGDPGANPNADAEGLSHPIRAALGPDLEPIQHAECLVSRCLESCTPGYRAMLEQFGVQAAPGDYPGKGCLEPSAISEEIP